MIHYHGGPITPESVAFKVWKARHAFVSYAHPRQLELAASVAQSFALDNGAFSHWRTTGLTEPAGGWSGYYEWVGAWMNHPAFDWAVIPDVIGGSEDENDELVAEWPHGTFVGVPVWHLDESIGRLSRLAEWFPRVALGSAAQYDVSDPAACLGRLAEALEAITDSNGRPVVKLHGLRMLNPAITSAVPLSSADSTSVARNVGLDVAWAGRYAPATPETRGLVLAERFEHVTTPDRMAPTTIPLALFG